MGCRAVPQLSHSVSGALRTFGFWLANGTVGLPLLNDIDYSCIFREPSALCGTRGRGSRRRFGNTNSLLAERALSACSHSTTAATSGIGRPSPVFVRAAGSRQSGPLSVVPSRSNSCQRAPRSSPLRTHSASSGFIASVFSGLAGRGWTPPEAIRCSAPAHASARSALSSPLRCAWFPDRAISTTACWPRG